MAIFVCQALCGCELEIAGQWVHPPDASGKYHAFPIRKPILGKPSSVTSIQIVSVCATHAPWQTEPLPADPYFGAVGYYDIPANPTPAEKLFIRFYQYVGLRSSFVCGCKAGVALDRKTGITTLHDHPQHSQRCTDHGIDKDHSLAQNEHMAHHKAVDAIKASLPEAFWTETDASARNREILSAWFGLRLTAAQQARIDTMNDAEVNAALSNEGLKPVSAGDAMHGVTIELTPTGRGTAQFSLAVSIAGISQADLATAQAAVDASGAAVKVTVT